MKTIHAYKGTPITELSAEELVEALALAIDELERLKTANHKARANRMQADIDRLKKQVRNL